MFFTDVIISGYVLIALNSPSVFPLRNPNVEEPKIAAKSALIYDVKRERPLFEKSSDMMLPLASLTKLLSSLVVLDSIPLQKVVTMDQKAIETFGDVGDFKIGEKVEARHLLFASLIQSSNDAMVGLSLDLGQENFLSLMRSKAISLGLKKITIDDPAGLSPKTRSSAQEFVKIAQSAFSNNFISQILSIPEYTFKSASGRAHKLVSTNPLIFDSRVLAAKTGSLKEVGENYVALVKGEDDQQFVMVIMGSTDRAKDAAALLNWLDKGFLWK